MASAKNKKRALLILLAVYFLVSIGLAAAYMLDAHSPDSKKAEEDKKVKIAAIHENLRAVDPGISEEKAKHAYKTLYGPQGSVMSVNLTIAMQVVNFGALLGFLYLLLWGPLTKFLDERKQEIKDEINEARQKHKEADRMLDEYRRKLAESRDEFAQMLEDGKKRGYDEEKRIIEQARIDADRQRRRTEAEIGGQVEEARTALRGEVSSISVAVAARILDREINEQDNSSLIRQAISEISEHKGI